MSWKKVCAVADLALDTPTVLEVDGVQVLFLRTGESVSAMPPLCPHMKEPLSNGICDGHTLTCLKHLWQWDIETGESTGEAEKDLCLYPLRVTDGIVQLELANELTYEYD